MRFSTILLGGLSLVAATPAFAQDSGSETAPPSPITISGSAAILTDYRLRGISQTNKNAAIQGALTIAHDSGFYIGTFASNLAGIVITTFTGVMLALTKGSFTIPLVVAGGFCFLGAFSYLVVVGRIEPLPVDPASKR